MYSSHARFGALRHVIRNIRTILSWLYVSAEKSYCRLLHYIKTLNTFLLCVFRESVMGELARWVRYTMQCMRMRDIWCQKVCLSVRLSVTIRYRILIHDLLLSSIFKHRDYNELTTHHLTHAARVTWTASKTIIWSCWSRPWINVVTIGLLVCHEYNWRRLCCNYMKTAESIVEILSPPHSPNILIFCN